MIRRGWLAVIALFVLAIRVFALQNPEVVTMSFRVSGPARRSRH